VCHVILIILIITHLRSLYFSSILDICRCYCHCRCWGSDCLCSDICSYNIWRFTVNFPIVYFEI